MRTLQILFSVRHNFEHFAATALALHVLFIFRMEVFFIAPMVIWVLCEIIDSSAERLEAAFPSEKREKEPVSFLPKKPLDLKTCYWPELERVRRQPSVLRKKDDKSSLVL